MRGGESAVRERVLIGRARCVYRFSICMVLCPVIEATSISPKPFSKSREVASCRSWKVRPLMLADLQTLSKAWEME